MLQHQQVGKSIASFFIFKPMKKIFRFLKYTFFIVFTLLLLLVFVLYLRYGGGKTYPDLTTEPVLGQNDLEAFFAFDEPVGNVAASKDTSSPVRVFFTVHPESRPEKIKVLEIVNGRAIPFPNLEFQPKFNTVLGMYTDRQNRLWTIDHGNHGTSEVKLLAFDLKTNALVHEYAFPSKVAELGSFFNDLCVSPDGRYVFVADVSFWRKSPSLVIYDTKTKKSRSLLDSHSSVKAQNWVPKNPTKDMRFFGGIVNLKPGIDGITVDHKGEFVYYAAMVHENLYRVAVKDLANESLSKEALAQKVEMVCKKPLSDGISADEYNNIYITDVDHQGLSVVNPQRKLRTLIKDPRIRWADGISFGSDGYCYFTDSAIPDQMLMSKKHIASRKPYYIFRFKPPYEKLRN